MSSNLAARQNKERVAILILGIVVILLAISAAAYNQIKFSNWKQTKITDIQQIPEGCVGSSFARYFGYYVNEKHYQKLDCGRPEGRIVGDGITYNPFNPSEASFNNYSFNLLLAISLGGVGLSVVGFAIFKPNSSVQTFPKR